MRITVFTPSYNRAYILENLYRSLQRQSFRDFEWLIVDDGSIDDTDAVVAGWQAEGNDFPIRYLKKENGGKHTAINTGLDLAQGELFFTVDSDDWLTDDALEKIDRWEKELPKKERFCGFAGRLQNTAGQLSGDRSDLAYFDGTAMDRYGIVNGERAMVFYTAIHRKYRYPVFSGERFVTEAVTWNRMAHDGYRLRFHNDVIWIYEYQPNGLTSEGVSLYQRNPQGYGLFMKEKAIFSGYGPWKMFVFYYSAYCDLQKFYHWKQIAQFVNAPAALMKSVDFLFRLKHFRDNS